MSSQQAPGRVPRHLAIIMDGNGRWAAGRALPRAAGHRAGAQTTRQIVEAATRQGIGTLTLFAFSSENWRRPSTEVRILLDLFVRTLRREVPDLNANNVRLHFIGGREHFSAALQKQIAAAEHETADNDGLQLVVAVDYGGRWDVVQAARTLAQACVDGDMEAAAIDETAFARQMTLFPHGEPDLFIRTGGEKRLSNFLLWDLAYSELFFTDTLWPDFDADMLAEAVAWYAERERRFGRVPAHDE